MLLSPISSRTLIEKSKSEIAEEKHYIKSNIEEIANKNKDFAPPLPPRKQEAGVNLLPLPPRGKNIENNSLLSRRKINNVNMPRLNFSQSNEDVKLREDKEAFLDEVKRCVNKNTYNEKAEKLFNNLNCLKYNNNDYQSVENSRYGDKLEYRKDTLMKGGNVLLPANNVSSSNYPNNITIAAQYPLNNKESLNNYFNMLYDNDIDTVYVLASNYDITKDIKECDGEIKNGVKEKLSKMGIKYNEENLKKEGFKYFRENLELENIKTKPIGKWSLSNDKKDTSILPCKVYAKDMVNNSSNGIENKDKNIKFVHIYDWKDHTGIDATKLRNTIDTIGDNLKTKPTKENIAVHCLAGLGRTGEFIALMEMVKMIEEGNTKEKSLESIITDLREKRSINTLYKPEQIAELVKFAINNNIPLLNDDINMK